MNDVATIQKARDLIDRLPVREVVSATEQRYVRVFLRLWKHRIIDLLHGRPSRDTYGVRRAACHFVGRKVLVELLSAIQSAETEGDLETRHKRLVDLESAVSRIGRPLEEHPPVAGEPDFSVASPWQSLPGPRPVRGAASKKHDLRHLPDDWREQVWQHMPVAYKEVGAALCLSPARPAEYLREREDKEPGGILVMRQGNTLHFESRPVKSHRGQYGTVRSIVSVDIVAAGAPARYLAELCDQAGGQFVITISSVDALRKAIARAGKRAKMPCGVSPYTFRHQCIADAKATLGAGPAVAAAAGHSSLRSQAKYGRVEHGRRGGSGLIAARADRPPREPSIPIAQRLGELKERVRSVAPAPS